MNSVQGAGTRGEPAKSDMQPIGDGGIAQLQRRAFLRLGALVPFALLPRSFRAQDRDQDTTDVARLLEPNLAGRPRRRVTDYQNDPFIIAIESRLQCTCGCTLDVYTCRTTDFTCVVSPTMHREVVALYENGKTGEEIIASFVATHGEAILMAPPKEGFNWAGYLLPGVLITAIGGTICAVLVRRQRLSDASTISGDPGGRAEVSAGVGQPITPEDRARLEAELQRIEP